MGLILETKDKILGLEERRESFNVVDLKREYPSEHKGKYYREQVINVKSQHIFAAADGEIEMSKDFLRRLVAFFDKLENRARLGDGYTHAPVSDLPGIITLLEKTIKQLCPGCRDGVKFNMAGSHALRPHDFECKAVEQREALANIKGEPWPWRKA